MIHLVYHNAGWMSSILLAEKRPSAYAAAPHFYTDFAKPIAKIGFS